MKILHLITELSTGGAQMALWRLLKGLDRERFRPVVACLYNGDGMVAGRIRELGIPVIDLGMTAKWRLDALERLYRLLRRERPCILHTWMFHVTIPGRLLGRLAGVPVIISAERTMGQESEARYWLNWLTAPLGDRVICVSERVADFSAEHIGLSPARLVVIPNGIELLPQPAVDKAAVWAELGRPRPEMVIGTVGRLEPVKGFPYLLEALAQLAPAYPAVHLLIVGDGPERTALEAQAHRLGLGERVIFAGHRTDVPLLMGGMDLFVLPSIWEGMPNVVLEAMAAGLPVVATAVGGTPEIVVEGETGLLVPPRDPAALAEAMERLLADPALRLQMGRAGRDRVQQYFDIERTIRLNEELYNTLINEKLPGTG